MGDAFYPLKVSTVTTHEHTHVIRCAAAMWKGSTSSLVVYLGLGWFHLLPYLGTLT